jgi:hypothetical protein
MRPRYRPCLGLAPDLIERLGRAPHLKQLTDLTVVVTPGPDGPEALAKAFPALESLDLDGLSPDGCEALARAGLPALRDLEVGFDRAGGRKAQRIRAVALLLTAPTFPNLSGFRIRSEPGIGGVGELLRRGAQRGPALRVLRLCNVELTPEDGEGIAACPALRGLMALDLSSNPIASEGAAAVAAGDWPKLVYLDLSSCQIGEAGARALAGAARMPQMQWVQLNCNPFGSEGCKAFMPGVFPHLRRLSISNCGETAGVKGVLRRRFGAALNS